MKFLLSIKTVFPKPGCRVWYDDQREVHRQIFEGDETIDYAFMGQDPDAADNRWLREAYENRIPVIYFLGIAPGRYQAILPTFITGWDAKALKARIAFGMPDQEALAPPHKRERSLKHKPQSSPRRPVVLVNVRCSPKGLVPSAAHVRVVGPPELEVAGPFRRSRLHDFQLCCSKLLCGFSTDRSN